MTQKGRRHGSEVALEYREVEGRSPRSALAFRLNDLIEKHCLSQSAAADITGMTKPKVSQVRRYNLENISLERLMQALMPLNQDVEIVVRPAQRTHAADINAAQ